MGPLEILKAHGVRLSVSSWKSERYPDIDRVWFIVDDENNVVEVFSSESSTGYHDR